MTRPGWLSAWLLLAGMPIGAAIAEDVTAADAAPPLANDVRILAEQYLDRAPSYSEAARAAARVRLDDLQRKADALDPLGFYLEVSRIVALADNGHDAVMRGDHSWNPIRRLPLRLVWFPEGLTVARAGPGYHDLLGATVHSIDGKTADDLMRVLRTLQGGTDDYRQWTLSGLLHSTDALHALGIARHADRVTLELQFRDGRRRVLTVPALAVDALPSPPRPQEYWYPIPLPGEAEKGWACAAPSDHVPVYLREPLRWFRMEPLADLDALYVQFRSNSDEDGDAIGPFVAAVAQRLATQPPRNLVLDLRFDTGGDNTQNLELMRQIARTVPGRIYVLTSHFTFSAGIASAAALKHDGGDRVTIVGRPVGDRMHWWSEYQRVCLPVSGLCVNRNEGLWDLEHGCHGDARCYGDRFDVNVHSLAPDLYAPIRAADWLAGTDPGLDAIRADIARRPSPH